MAKCKRIVVTVKPMTLSLVVLLTSICIKNLLFSLKLMINLWAKLRVNLADSTQVKIQPYASLLMAAVHITTKPLKPNMLISKLNVY